MDTRNQKTMSTTTEDLNNILKIDNVGKGAYFLSVKHEFRNDTKSTIINYCTSFYYDEKLIIDNLKNGGVYVTALMMLDRFLAEQQEYCNCIDLNDNHLLELFTYFFNTIKK